MIWRYEILRLGSSSDYFLNDEQELYLGMLGEWDGCDVGDDGYDLAAQAVQELFQLVLVFGHFQFETVDTVFHFLPPVCYARILLAHDGAGFIQYNSGSRIRKHPVGR